MVHRNTAKRYKPQSAGKKLRPPSLEEEVQLLKYYAGKAQDMCRAFGFPVKVQAAAVAFLQRFYLGRSPLRHDPKDILLAAIYLAGKVGCSTCHLAADLTGEASDVANVSSHSALSVCGSLFIAQTCRGCLCASLGGLSLAHSTHAHIAACMPCACRLRRPT